MPIYQGGEVVVEGARSRRRRSASAGSRLDAARDQVRQAVISAWGSLDAARAQIDAANAQVVAQQLVVSGEIEQRKVGQATTLDVLNAQQDAAECARCRRSAPSTTG